MATTRPHAKEAPQHRAPTGSFALRIKRRHMEPVEVRLLPERTYTIGRAADADVVLDDDHVSRYHAMVSVEQGAWQLRDLGSENGCHDEAGRRVARALVLHQGQRVFLGEPEAATWVELALAEVAEPLKTGVTGATRALESFVTVSARHQLPLVLLGSSGSGKSWLARRIHDASKLPGKFAAVNCGALGDDIASVHSELLGHVRGAFTGAHSDRLGKLQFAEQGTVFLDEIEAMPRVAQDFLIDVLDRRADVAPLGAPPSMRQPVPRFRLISASKTPLATTSLRHDLIQRLAVGDVFALPTLAERRADIPLLVEGFLEELRASTGLTASFSAQALKHLKEQTFSGELRELRATVEALAHRQAAHDGQSTEVSIGLGEVVEYLERRKQVLGAGVVEARAEAKRPSAFSASDLESALRRNDGNKTHTAKELGMALNTLKALMKKHGVG